MELLQLRRSSIIKIRMLLCLVFWWVTSVRYLSRLWSCFNFSTSFIQVIESVVKNCGSPVHDEVATKQFMEELRELAKTTHHENVKDKILELILTWAHAFRCLL